MRREVNEEIDILDNHGIYCPGIVKKVLLDTNQYLVGYKGWESVWDQKLPFDSSDISNPGEHVTRAIGWIKLSNKLNYWPGIIYIRRPNAQLLYGQYQPCPQIDFLKSESKLYVEPIGPSISPIKLFKQGIWLSNQLIKPFNTISKSILIRNGLKSHNKKVFYQSIMLIRSLDSDINNYRNKQYDILIDKELDRMIDRGTVTSVYFKFQGTYDLEEPKQRQLEWNSKNKGVKRPREVISDNQTLDLPIVKKPNNNPSNINSPNNWALTIVLNYFYLSMHSDSSNHLSDNVTTNGFITNNLSRNPLNYLLLKYEKERNNKIFKKINNKNNFISYDKEIKYISIYEFEIIDNSIDSKVDSNIESEQGIKIDNNIGSNGDSTLLNEMDSKIDSVLVRKVVDDCIVPNTSTIKLVDAIVNINLYKLDSIFKNTGSKLNVNSVGELNSNIVSQFVDELGNKINNKLSTKSNGVANHNLSTIQFNTKNKRKSNKSIKIELKRFELKKFSTSYRATVVNV